jgi:hypothetical protein
MHRLVPDAHQLQWFLPDHSLPSGRFGAEGSGFTPVCTCVTETNPRCPATPDFANAYETDGFCSATPGKL